MAVVGVIGAILGAMGTLGREVLINRFGKQTRREAQKENEDITLWKELRGELTELRKEIDAVRIEVDLWKGKYWALMDEHLTLKAQYITVQAEVAELRQLVNLKAEAN